MAEKKSKVAVIKTKPTDDNVEAFIKKVPDEQKRADSMVLLDLFKKTTREKPVLWSNSIIGFGIKRYKSPTSGREVDWMMAGFSPRKANMTIYITAGFVNQAAALKKLGKHKLGGGCLYINKLEDIDLNVLKGMIAESFPKK